MGRQIRFFMSKADEYDFLNAVNDYKHLILDRRANLISFEEVINPQGTIITPQEKSIRELQLFLTVSNNILLDKNGFIDQTRAEVIDFSRCKEWTDKVLREGRLWVEMKYWDETPQLRAKSPELEKMYKEYVKWIKKRYKLSKDKNYYIGPDTYKKYKEEGYLMKNGPKTFVEFD